MAIIVEQKRKEHSAFPIFILAVVLILALTGAYLLFLAPAPETKVSLPEQLSQAKEISAIQFDPSSVLGGAQFRTLRSYVGELSPGTLGRQNPFISY